ncbi:MAG: hypothetical protein ACRC4M_01140 [Mycoplasma sp.]
MLGQQKITKRKVKRFFKDCGILLILGISMIIFGTTVTNVVTKQILMCGLTAAAISYCVFLIWKLFNVFVLSHKNVL